jgi:hypothetical protein
VARGSGDHVANGVLRRTYLQERGGGVPCEEALRQIVNRVRTGKVPTQTGDAFDSSIVPERHLGAMPVDMSAPSVTTER